jgi:hypothetical protein
MGAGSFFDAIDNIVAFTTKWVNAGKKFDDARKAWEKAQERARLAEERFQTRKETRLGWLEFGLERAETTKTLTDDRSWLRKREAFIKELIQHEGRTLELVRDLWETRQRIKDLNKSKADAGDPLAGLMQVSSKRLANILAAGTGLGVQGRSILGMNIAGLEMRPVYVSVQVDGREIGRASTRDQARTSRRTSRQTSGYRG